MSVRIIPLPNISNMIAGGTSLFAACLTTYIVDRLSNGSPISILMGIGAGTITYFIMKQILP